LADRRQVDVVTSLAGRTRSPRLPAGEVRTGGFGGVDGLVRYLAEARIDLVIDATHPFAAVISRNAVEACARTDMPRRMLLRPEWAPEPEDRWIDAADAAEAAKRLAGIPGSVFLAIGRQELEPFAGLTDRRFLLRMVEPPEAPLPLSQASIVTGRGPFDLEAEKAMFDAHDIAVVVSKNSGGVSAYAKIQAARAAHIPVIMIRRPALPDGPHVETISDALAWIEEMSG
jgi:precorrin-6A/cobalt-precorrin-6A reductase